MCLDEKIGEFFPDVPFCFLSLEKKVFFSSVIT